MSTQHPFYIGLSHMKEGDYQTAKDFFLQSLKLNPQDIDNYINIAICLRFLCQYEEALSYLQKAISLNPNDPDIYLNMGVILREMLMIDEAIKSYRKAIEICPTLHDAYYNLALAFLIKGDYKKGWNLYQKRWFTTDFLLLPKLKKRWHGKFDNNTLLIRSEQGLGDTIQFVRYAKYLSSNGMTVKLKCQPQLVSLLDGQCGISSVSDDEKSLGDYDYDCYMLDLPYLLKTDLNCIPSDISYITAKEDKIDKFKDIIRPSNKLKVGICWRGSKTNIRAFNRSLEIELLSPIFNSKEGITFYSLQLSDSLTDLVKLPVALRPIDLSSHIKDFSDTAGIIHHIDLVISIDSSIAHLAGAMGKRTLLLLNYSSDWRWSINRNDSQWYPTIQIIRQDKPCNWRSVIDDVKVYLTENCNKKL